MVRPSDDRNKSDVAMSPEKSTDDNLEETTSMTAAQERTPVQSPRKPSPGKDGEKSPKLVGFVQGSNADFSHLTNDILRDRLQLASLILSCGYTAFLVKGILLSRHETHGLMDWVLLGMLAFTASVTGIIAWRLCAKCPHVLNHLRGIEATVFGLSGLLFLIAGYTTLIHAASSGYMVNISPPWLVLIFTYALFIPNSWQRAARVIIIMALGPLVVLGAAWMTSPQVETLIEDTTQYHHIFLETIMAMTFTSAIAIGGVRLIRSLRTQAYEAQQMGQYRLKRLLGRGGMGEVYLGEHVMLKRPCAIKIIRPEKAGDPNILARFEQEVQATARLTHWNTVEIYDYGRTDDGTFYYVMEYLSGMSLDQIVEMHGPLEASRALHLLSQTCDALAEAHAHCLVHRDLKPANIFAAKRGGIYDVAKLLDFGLVRSLQPETALQLTQESVVTGSPLYMSPEQARGDEVDRRSDIYALGCTFYLLLTGRTPFVEPTAIKLLLAHAQQEPEPPSRFRDDIPADVEAIIMKCLEKSADRRYQDVLELQRDLKACKEFGAWDRSAAKNWWESHGCPKKLELDTCISQGIEIDEAMQATSVFNAQLVNA